MYDWSKTVTHDTVHTIHCSPTPHKMMTQSSLSVLHVNNISHHQYVKGIT